MEKCNKLIPLPFKGLNNGILHHIILYINQCNVHGLVVKMKLEHIDDYVL